MVIRLNCYFYHPKPPPLLLFKDNGTAVKKEEKEIIQINQSRLNLFHTPRTGRLKMYVQRVLNFICSILKTWFVGSLFVVVGPSDISNLLDLCNMCVCVCLFAKEEIGCILQLSNLGKGYLWIWNRWIVFIRRQNILWQNCCFFRGLWLYGARLCLQPVICYWPPFFQQST